MLSNGAPVCHRWAGAFYYGGNMNISVEQLQSALIKYIDTEIGPKATGMTKFLIYFMAPSIPKIVNEKVKELQDTGIMTDLFTADGLIDIDAIYGRAKSAIERSGKILIPKLNYFVDGNDIDMIYEIIKRS